jgi:hypothetical protein
VKYAILIYDNPRSREVWQRLPPEQRAEGLRAYAELDRDLAESGEMVASEALAGPAEGRRVVVRDGAVLVTDGPFAEAKEFLAGFYLVECDGLERAVEHAARVPEATFGTVEIRPVLELGGPEM